MVGRARHRHDGVDGVYVRDGADGGEYERDGVDGVRCVSLPRRAVSWRWWVEDDTGTTASTACTCATAPTAASTSATVSTAFDVFRYRGQR
jgi:hypothetical protein